MLLGSCFTTEMGKRMLESGFRACVNPFGTLYNPASIAGAVSRLDSGSHFTENDCVEMGAGASLTCSFEHHTSFARPTPEEFLACANGALDEARQFWDKCNRVIITLGTAFVWSHNGKVVSNCLKRPASEFERKMLTPAVTASLLEGIVISHPEKQFILTVSPIRHLGDGAHANTLSKSVLHLGIESMLHCRQGLAYFPSYEILCDELRDYRFYASDLVHPSEMAVDYIWEKFRSSCVPQDQYSRIEQNRKNSRRAAHRPLH